MTKSKAALSTEVQAPAAAAPAEQAPAAHVTPANLGPLPQTLRIFGPIHTTLPELAALSRIGYTVDCEWPVEYFPQAATLSIFLRLGSPADSIVKAAHATVELAAAAERAQYTKDVLAAARQMVEDDKRAAKEAEVAAAIAATKAKIAALEATLQA